MRQIQVFSRRRVWPCLDSTEIMMKVCGSYDSPPCSFTRMWDKNGKANLEQKAWVWSKYRKSGNFRYMKFSLGKIFVLKNFRRVNVLRKYLNTKILQQRNCIRSYHVYKKYGWRRLERRLCAKESPKTSDQYAVAVKNEGTIIEHLPRKLSRVCSLFLRWGSTQSQVWVLSASTWNGAEYNTHRNYLL